MKGSKDLAEAAMIRLRPVKVEVRDAPSHDEPVGEDDDAEAWESIAGDLVDAIKGGDKTAVADALKAAMALCMAGEHQEEY